MSEWFEDEAFWDGLYPFMFADRKFEVADDQVADILELAGLEGGSVLDLACGPGRHAAALAKRGFRVTGVDLSPSLLRRARDRARAEGVDVEWVREDMRRFVRPDAFDLAINIFTAFGYFDDRQDDLQVLRNIHQSLRKGGAFVIEVMGKECLARHFQSRFRRSCPTGGCSFSGAESSRTGPVSRTNGQSSRMARQRHFGSSTPSTPARS